MAATEAMAPLAFRRFPGHPDSTRVRPLISPDAAPFYDALQQGRLVLQVCTACARARWPAGPVCPHCGDAGGRWQAASGRGRIHSWTRYHRAFMPEFEALLPYSVLNVALAEGPRLIGRWVGQGEVAVDMPVCALVERWDDGLCTLAFAEESSA